MTISQPANTYTLGGGTAPSLTPIVAKRSPSVNDVNYPVGQRWINSVAFTDYTLDGFTSSGGVVQAQWSLAGSEAGALNTLSDGSTTVTPTAGNIEILGTASQITSTGTNSPGAITLSLPSTLVAPGSLEVTGLLLGDASATINTAGTALNLATDNDTAAVNIGNGTSARTINVGTTTGVKTINIGTSASANVLTIGSTTASASLALQSGSGGNTSIAGNAAATITIGAAAQTGTISVGTSSASNTVNVGTGNGAKTIAIGTGTGGNTVSINNGAGANTTTVGSTNTTSTTTINAGSGSVVLGSGVIVKVASAKTANYPAVGSDYFIPTDTTAGVVTITLPATPTTGQSYVIYDSTGQAATHNVTISGNGNNISAGGTSAATKTLSTAYQSMTLYFNGTIWNGQLVT